MSLRSRRRQEEVSEIAPAALPGDPEEVLDALLPLLTPERLARVDRVIAGRTRDVVLVLDRILDPHNAAAILRTAEGLGIQEVHVVSGDETFLASTKVTKYADRWLDVVHHGDVACCAASLRSRGYTLLVATMDGAVPSDALASVPRAAIVLGNEHSGVSEAFRAAADGTFAIPMFGMVESFNVSVAAAITLSSALRGRNRGLPERDHLALRARFACLSIDRADEIVAAHRKRPRP